MGDNIDLYIDGQPLPGGSVVLTDHPEGQFGFWTGWGESYYDNLEVSGSIP
jgi:hypothetical protein